MAIQLIPSCSHATTAHSTWQDKKHRIDMKFNQMTVQNTSTLTIAMVRSISPAIISEAATAFP